MADYIALASQFRRFAETECGLSPLYRALTSTVADDEAVLTLAAQAASQPRPNLLLAAVHYLLLQGEPHELRRFYPSLGGSYREGDPVYPSFRSFCLAHAEALLALLRTRRVQTNEVARASILLPAFSLIAGRTRGAPLALIEVGASAGLLLLWDRYAYDYGEGRLRGAPDSPVRLSCEVRGAATPPLPDQLPQVVSRVGIDLYPIDVRDPEATRWLQALVWPDQTERAAMLAQALDLARADPPRLMAGDAFDATPVALAEVPAGSVPIVFHCHTLNQFSPEDRERFVRMLAAASTGRTLYHVALEYSPGAAWPEMRLQVYSDGILSSWSSLAEYQAHGNWIGWSLQDGE